MDLLDHLRASARANRLANLRLARAMAPLSDADLHAPRVGFFPSLEGTLNHILAVDIYYLAGLHGEADMRAQIDGFIDCRTLAEWAGRQAASDERLIAFCDALDAAGIDSDVAMDRGDHVDHNAAGRILAHLFMHQTHHRGQLHAMLSSTRIAPPQLDEFLLPADARFRRAEMTTLGWTEAQLMGAQAQAA